MNEKTARVDGNIAEMLQYGETVIQWKYKICGVTWEKGEGRGAQGDCTKTIIIPFYRSRGNYRGISHSTRKDRWKNCDQMGSDHKVE